MTMKTTSMAEPLPSHDEAGVESGYLALERSFIGTLPNGGEEEVNLPAGSGSSDLPTTTASAPPPAAARRHDDTKPGAPSTSRFKAGRLHKLLCGASFETLVFSFRVSVSVTIASLFLLAFPTSNPWPDPVWILFTCIFVTWQPSIDAGTAFKKFIERLGGTLFGAVLAFGVGYLSLAVGTVEGQAVFLGFVFAIEGFLYPFLADRLGYRNSYGALVGNLTFAIAVFAFYNPKGDNPPWFTPLYRCINVLIGCVIAATVSVIVYPVSTRTLLIRNVLGLISTTGKHTGMALQAAAESFESGAKPLALSVLLRGMDSGNHPDPDPVHATYVKNLDAWKSSRALLPILKYDPWFWTMSADDRGEFKHAMLILVVRTLRIQMNIVLLDSILRSDAEYKGPTEAIRLLPAIGQRIEAALSVKLLDAEERKTAIKELIDKHLPLVRAQIVQAAAQSQSSGGDSTELPNFARLESLLEGGVLPLSVLNQQGGQTLLFFQLIEQLIFRVAKLHFCLQQYQSCVARRKCDGCSLS